MAVSIELAEVSKTFGKTKALDDLSLRVEGGTILGLLGPNGAGKTTVMRICSTLLRADCGRVLIDGSDLQAEKNILRRSIALMPQGNALDPMLNAEDNLRFYCKLKRMSPSSTAQSLDRAIETFGLAPFLRKSVFALSGGQFRRTQLARAFLGEPRQILLDEPTLGIDIQGKMAIWDSLRTEVLARGCTVLLASNDMTEVERTCDGVVFINRGRKLYQGKVDNLKGVPFTRLKCTLRNTYSAEAMLPPNDLSVAVQQQRVLMLDFPEYSENLFRFVLELEAKFGVVSLTEEKASLTDLFTLYGDQKHDIDIVAGT